MFPPVYTDLRASADVVALVATRIYPHGEAPQDVAKPYITWFTVLGSPENELSDVPGVDRVSIQVDCWTGTPAEARALALATRTALEAVAHCTGMPVDGRELDETKLYRIALQFDYWLSRSAQSST